MYVLNKALAARIEAAETATWQAMVDALAELPGNPWARSPPASAT